MDTSLETLNVESDAFKEGGFIPVKYTGYGEDISPELKLSNISPEAESLAVIMDDNDAPGFNVLNHWIIWNIPVQDVIPENITYGEKVDSLNGAIQGVAYGKHRYRGPKPPSFIKKTHEYKFYVLVLDCRLDIKSASRKKELLAAMDGHILQYGVLTGKFNNKAKEQN